MSITRVTKKSRTVSEFVDTIIELVDDGTRDIQKSVLVDAVVSGAIADGTSKAISDVLATEMANLLDNYFSDVCKAAEDELRLPYHLTSRAWYKKGARPPQSEEEARQYVVVFGNGNTGRSAGVRFVTVEDEPDPMLLVSLNKRIDVINAAIKTRNLRLKTTLASEAVSVSAGSRLVDRLPDLS